MSLNETHPYGNFALRCICPNVPKMAQSEYKNFQLYVFRDRRWCVGFVESCIQLCSKTQILPKIHDVTLCQTQISIWLNPLKS